MDMKINLCDTCPKQDEFPTCLPNDQIRKGYKAGTIIYGTGLGNDNIIKCSNYTGDVNND